MFLKRLRKELEINKELQNTKMKPVNWRIQTNDRKASWKWKRMAVNYITVIK